MYPSTSILIGQLGEVWLNEELVEYLAFDSTMMGDKKRDYQQLKIEYSIRKGYRFYHGILLITLDNQLMIVSPEYPSGKVIDMGAPIDDIYLGYGHPVALDLDGGVRLLMADFNLSNIKMTTLAPYRANPVMTGIRNIIPSLRIPGAQNFDYLFLISRDDRLIITTSFKLARDGSVIDQMKLDNKVAKVSGPIIVYQDLSVSVISLDNRSIIERHICKLDSPDWLDIALSGDDLYILQDHNKVIVYNIETKDEITITTSGKKLMRLVAFGNDVARIIVTVQDQDGHLIKLISNYRLPMALSVD